MLEEKCARAAEKDVGFWEILYFCSVCGVDVSGGRFPVVFFIGSNEIKFAANLRKYEIFTSNLQS